MAEFRPNEAQARAIRESGKNILVSAGAGSGKTTVLVERVLRMIMEELVDIDSLIIVTFTRAAAANMKEKIYNRIRAALKDDSLSDKTREHLEGQLLRVFSARICTIDSLCMDIVRDHFQYVDIDPAFRIADEAEITLLMQDVLSQMIEDCYAEQNKDFLDFAGYYTDKNDARLEDIILTMYRFSQSHPEPELWLRRAAGPYVHADRFGQVPDEAENLWLCEFAAAANSEIGALLAKAEKGLILCDMNYGPFAYLDNFAKVYQELLKLEGESFDNKVAMIEESLSGWKRLPSVKKEDDISEELKQNAQELYKELKAGLARLQDHYFYQPLESMYQDMGKCAGIAKTIVSLTMEFTRRFAEEKKARLIADFNDVAHFALGVLEKRNEQGELVYTEAADNIAKATREIIVDEYQDTNRMQDALITALSAERFGRPDVFMVGDVKQSIYGFRLACPDLFIEKYRAYQDPEGNGTRIILGENYRSRKEIVSLINFVFEKVMLAEVGGIDYQDGNRMIAGASFPEADDPAQFLPEVLFIEGSGDDGKDAESYEITRKIEEIVGSGYVTGEDGALRRAKYSDIAILTRKTNNPRLEKMLADRHIPVRKSSSKGFFGSFEIRLAMDLLRVTDNPYQDIPLAAVLMSPVAGLDANDLARIRTNCRNEPLCLYSACLSYAEEKDDACAKKLKSFLLSLQKWSRLADASGISRFLELLFEESGLYDCALSMTYGKGRAANLDYLKALADSFAKSSYSGLFNFIRYIDAVQKADQDFGSGISPDSGDSVTMMTIHKSKGLEFPVVILADCGKLITDLDSASPVYTDDTLGLGIELRDLDTRVKRKTLLMETIAAKKKTAVLAEEIRLLYVALSRAKEKLVITGSKGNLSSRRRDWEDPSFPPDAGSVRSDNSYMFLLGDAMRCAGEQAPSLFEWSVRDLEEVEIGRAEEVFHDAERRAEIEDLIQRMKDAEETEALAEKAGIYAFDYPYLTATRTGIKITASQMEKHETDREQKEEPQLRLPQQSSAALTGAERGNAYHKLFELLDYQEAEQWLSSAEEGTAKETMQRFSAGQIRKLQAAGYLDEEAAGAIEPEKIAEFLLSGIGTRMRKAALKGTLKREQQFVMAAEIDGEPDGLLQGIIDAFFIEDGSSIILVDYKTDRRTEPSYFIETYQGQQDGYAGALEAAFRLPVTEKLLYSVELGCEIRLP